MFVILKNLNMKIWILIHTDQAKPRTNIINKANLGEVTVKQCMLKIIP